MSIQISQLNANSPHGLLIDGEGVASADGETYDLVDPATEEPLTEVYRATEHDADAAVESASRAFEAEWRDLDPADRERTLLRLAELLRERSDEFTAIESRNVGKPIHEAQWDVANSASHIQYHASLPQKIEGETIPVAGDRLDYTLRDPYGVSVHITPWNYPLGLAVRDVAPALACGNTVVIKPPTSVPLSSLEFGRLALEAGLPPGAVNVVPGPGSTIGNRLIGHEQTGVVTFTGSVETGRRVAEAAARNLVPVNLELGGKSPNIVFADASLSSAVRGAISAIFVNAGQMCVAGSRLLLQEEIADEFMEQLIPAAESLTVGTGDDDDVDMGPIVSREQYETVMSYIERGTEQGATLATGGGRPDEAPPDGNFVEPTVFTDVDNDMDIAQEEIFGPVLSVITFEDVAEAIEIANDTEYGLYAAVWTSDLGRAHRVVEGVEAGTVAVNQFHTNYPQAPFGGYKNSGIGRESGMQAVDSYTQTKNAIINYYG
jgi:aldehyde dehydrogenase (NAD+)